MFTFQLGSGLNRPAEPIVFLWNALSFHIWSYYYEKLNPSKIAEISLIISKLLWDDLNTEAVEGLLLC